MANDPNRDFLPVKDVDDRSSKAGINYRMDLNIIGKLKRCDLEERYMRLYDENTQIKKQLNCQEEKIKRLGTKLLRLIGEKKNCPDSCRRRQDGKGVDELQMRIIELEHENYTLKDRNVVLKQQLANHARQHVAAHRSPNRSIHNSPRMSQRQSSAPNVNESNYMLSNRNQGHDIQLREAEEHINGLNDEIKSLHSKIDVLQQDLEKSSLENQKTKVCENIELIRLQRSLKQQSVQIAALQAQIKNSEKNQKLLRDELASAHKENEESLQIISDKQKEILDLYTKLEERNVGRLECEEMKERIKDLTSERDSLRERGEFLMKTIESKSSEAEMIKELKRLLESEKCKKKELKESLENTQKLLRSLKDMGKACESSEGAVSEAAVTAAAEEEEADKTVGTVEERSRSDYSKNGQGNELDFLASPRAIYPNERNSDSWEADSKVEDREGGKYRMRRSASTVPAGEGSGTNDAGAVGTASSNGKVTALASLPGRNQCGQSEGKTLQQALAQNNPYVKGNEPVPGSAVVPSNTHVYMSDLQPLIIIQAPPDCRTQQNSQVPHYSQGPPVPQVLQYSQGQPVPQVLQYSQGQPVPQVLQYSQGQLVPQVLQYFQAPSVPQILQYSLGPPVPQVLHCLQGSQWGKVSNEPGVPKDKEKFEAKVNLEVKQDSDLGKVPPGPQTTEVPKAHQGPQTSAVSQTTVVPKKKKNSKAKENVEVKQDSDSGKVPPGPQTTEVPTAHQGPQTSAVSQTTVVPKKKKNPKGKENLEVKQDSNLGKVPPVPQVPNVEDFEKLITPRTFVKLSIDWLQLKGGSSILKDESIKLLYVDFAFLDVRGEETETPVSLRKPKTAREKCFFNFATSIRITRERANFLRVMRNRQGEKLIVFKIVSEPEEPEEECVDVGVANLRVKQFFMSNPNTRILLPVLNTDDLDECIGLLSVRLDISPSDV